MTSSNRRIFLLSLAAAATATGGAALAVTPVAAPGPAGKVEEKDATATALGYVADSSKVDKKRYPNATAAQKCNNCALYGGKAADAQGPCPIFSGKQVAATGWCSSWTKKA